jgi:hypothetical protein
VEDSCEHGNEPSGCTEFWEILEWLSDWWLLKKGSAPWSELVYCMCSGFAAITDDWSNSCHVQLASDEGREVSVVSEEEIQL